MNAIRYDQYGYYFAPNLNTNSTAPSVPFGDYYIKSFGYPTNGSSALYHFDTNGFNQTGGGPFGYGDFNGMMHELTNGNWSIFVTNSLTTNVYYFTVTANISSNDLPIVSVTFPTNGAVNVTSQPTYAWQGPTDYNGLVVYGYNFGIGLTPSQTSLPSPNMLYQGINNFTVHYDSNSITALVSSTPLDSGSHPISSWVSTAHLQDYITSKFTVGAVDTSGTSHILVAHYPWDVTNSDGTASGVDTSGSGYNMNFGGNSGSQGGENSTTNAAAGPRAIQFHDGDGNSTGFVGWNPTPAGLLTALSGSFSVSCWIKTTQNNFGWDTAPAYYGAGIVSADNAGLANDVIPIALTGDTIGFNTGGDQDVTLNSIASVNDGNYHHVVVTRNQQTGQKIIYIDGVLDSFSSGTTNLLNDPQKLTIGALADAGDPDANDGGYNNGYDGELDDLQIYSGVLSASDVANLFANPGSTVANGGGAGSSGGHSIVARYNFEQTNSPGVDSSGHGNDANCGGGDGNANVDTFSTDAVVGNYSRDFLGHTFICFSPPAVSFNNLSNALSGSFSVSTWVKTTQSVNNDNDNADAGANILFAEDANTNSTVPLALTGSKVAFSVNDHNGVNTTLHSQTSVNDGQYHQIAVTRNQANGVMKIYVDGNLEGSANGSADLLYAKSIISLGGYFNDYNGLLDDVQIYSGVLSDTEVASLYTNPGTTVPDVASGPVVHYDFDEGTVLAADVSGNNNNIIYAGHFSGSGPTISTNAAAGSGSVSFDGGSYLTASSNLLSTLAGEFSVSLWLKTSQSYGNPGDVGWEGAGIISADSPNSGAKDLIPVALTGGQVAFNIGDGSSDNTLNSSATVNDNNWHHVVVTRSQSTGARQIFIDGTLDSSDIASTVLLNSPVLLTIGCKSDASNPDPTSPSQHGSNGYQGLLDDIQIYNRVLSSQEVTYLYQNPGAVVASASAPDFNAALNTTNLIWTTSGNTSWFVETTNTHDNVSAAQSGVVTNNQSSTLSVTVTGPGTLMFWWASIADDNNFDYVAYLDGDPNGGYFDDLDVNTSYHEDGPFNIPAGTHTISWTAFAEGDEDPTEAGFLDQVSFLPDTPPVITGNPFNQTNYPGYPVGLSASANANPAATWQWYKVSSGAISGATNSFYTPTNSGTSGVQGSYYAIATNPAGSANTTTAAVAFVSAPLPPDWSVAFKSPFYAAASESDLIKDYYYGCIVDTNGNVYAAAEFGGNTVAGSTYLNSGTGGDAAAIVKQSPTGAPLWAVGITNKGVGNSYGECVAPAPGGGVYLSGDYNGTNFLGTNQLTDPGNGAIFLARFDSTGSNLWVKTFGTTNGNFTLLNSLTADPSGNVTLSGLLGAGPVTIGSSNYNIVGQEGVLIQCDQTGAVRWSQVLPSDPQYLTYNAGRIYASIGTSTTGTTTNVVIGGVSNVTDRAWAVAALNATNGQAVWVRGVGTPYGTDFGNPYFANLIDDVPRLAVSGTNVFLTGVAYSSSAAFGAITVNFGALRGQYFARYDTNGNAQVATTYGSVTTTPIAAVADANGNVYVSGNFDTFSFFANDMIAAPDNDRPYSGDFSQAFLAKFDLNGNPLWAREAVSPATVNFLGLALATNGVWASGWCLSTNGGSTVANIFGTNLVYSDEQIFVGGAGGSIFIQWNQGGVLAKITDNTVVASPVTLLNPQDNGVNFQFSFLSQAGFSHNILYRTNLVTGSWLTNSTVIGDGTLKTNSIPLSLFSPSKQGFIRVSTQ
jgi:hypothetical protein